MTIAIEQASEATTEIRDLIAELDDVLGAAYEPHQRHGLAIDQLFEPHMRFYVARLDGIGVGCGGVALFADFAEVKRMYTRPGARGRGVGKALLRRIEEIARAAGLPVLRLETGTRQREAVGLYERVGFAPCRAFGSYAAMAPAQVDTSLFYEKSLG